MSRGITGLKQVHKVVEKLDVAGNPECSIVGVAELFLGDTK